MFARELWPAGSPDRPRTRSEPLPWKGVGEVELPTLIYDGDCGFCTRSVRLVERLPVRVRVVPWQEADLAALRVTAQRARHEVLWVPPQGRVLGGAAAVAELLRQCRFPWPVLGWFLSAPLLRSLGEVAYRWVARNRHRLPGATPACQLPADQRPGAADR